MTLINQLKAKLVEYPTSNSNFAECSKDISETSTNYLVNNNTEIVYNFDTIKNDYCEELELKKPLCSMDSLYFNDDEIELIEFKNAKKVKWKDIKMKIHDSLVILTSEFNVEVKDLKKFKCIIVYNPNKDGNHDMREHGDKRSGNTRIMEGLHFFEKIYGMKIRKIKVEDFISQYKLG